MGTSSASITEKIQNTFSVNKSAVAIAVRMSLEEDIGSGDITAELIPKDRSATAIIISNEAGIFCGTPWAAMVFELLDPSVVIDWKVRDGEAIHERQTLAILKGRARSLVTGERCALNWLQTLSGTATQVSRYVEQLQDTKIRLLDTRKTIPGLRH